MPRVSSTSWRVAPSLTKASVWKPMQPSQRAAHADRKRDQFLRLLVQCAIARGGLRERRKRLHGIGYTLAQCPQVSGNALGEFGVVRFHLRFPYLLDDGCGEAFRAQSLTCMATQARTAFLDDALLFDGAQYTR